MMMNCAYGQSISSSVISSSGGSYAASSGMISFTIAEMAMVESFTTSSAILLQGFQQPTDFGLGVEPISQNAFPFSIYPNPANNQLNVIVNPVEKTFINLKIADISGKILMSKEYSLYPMSRILNIDISVLSSGLYLISFDNLSAKSSVTQKFQVIK